MAAVMATQTGLIYSVENNLPNAKACGIGAAAMLFIFQGAFTIGDQAGMYLSFSTIGKLDTVADSHQSYGCIPRRFYL